MLALMCLSLIHKELHSETAGIPVNFSSTGRLLQNFFQETPSSAVLARIMVFASHPIRNKLNSFLVLHVMLLKAELMPKCSEFTAAAHHGSAVVLC